MERAWGGDCRHGQRRSGGDLQPLDRGGPQFVTALLMPIRQAAWLGDVPVADPAVGQPQTLPRYPG